MGQPDTKAFTARIIGYYDVAEGNVLMEYNSDRPEKQLAELAKLEDIFARWLADETSRLKRVK